MGFCMLYFGYGSNCDPNSLHRYLAQHGVDPKGIANPRRAFLDGWTIRTNYLRDGRTGAANIEPAKGKRVEGLLMDIGPEVHHLLRRKEGCPNRYGEASIFVHLPRSRRMILALTYIVTQECRLPIDMPVVPSYREIILEGAKKWGFSRDYQKRLRALLRTVDEFATQNEYTYVRTTR